MSDPTTTEPTAKTDATPTDPKATTQGDPAVDDAGLGQSGEKALRAERDARRAAERSAAALQKQIDDINAANMTDLEKAKKAAADAQSEADKHRAEALRYRVAAKHGITDDDAELFLTGTDSDTLERQAARLVERTPTNPRPDPSQGAKGDQGASSDPAAIFADFISQTGQ